MKLRVASALLLTSVLAAAGAPKKEGGKFREVNCLLVDEAGKPVAGVTMELRGHGRDAIHSLLSHPDDPARDGRKYEGWLFVTDREGKFKARFGTFRGWEHEQSTGVVTPGWGEFNFIAEKEGYAGAVSPRIVNLNAEDRKNYQVPELSSRGPVIGEEWVGYEDEAPVVLGDKTEAAPVVQIVLRRGIDISGQLVDPAGHAISDENVNLWTDLGADTHTGRGGEIFEQSATTDPDGRFQFHHVYPNLFYISLESEARSLFWTRTQIRERWADEIVDAIWPHAQEGDLPLVIVAAREPPFHYFGKISDETGKPIAGATVRVQASIHGSEGRSDFGDRHSHHSQAVTGEDGVYDVPAAGKYVNWFEITAPGFADSGAAGEGGQISGFDRYDVFTFAPGRYDFSLKKK